MVFLCFCYVGNVTLGTKINKILLHTLQKTTLKTMPQLISISEPSWLHFRRVLGARMGPSWFQMPLEIHSKTNPKHYHFLNACKIEFFMIFGSNLGGPGGSNYQLWEVFVSSWGHLGPKMVPYGPQIPPRRPKALILMILDSKMQDFGTQLA